MRSNLSLLRGGCTLAALVLLSPPAPLGAQEADAVAAWNLGRYGEARDDYLRTPGPDPASRRADYRQRVLAAWGGDLDAVLADLIVARNGAPEDAELRSMQAQMLGWAGRYQESLALWDSIIAIHPAGSAGVIGKARTLSWEGRDRQADSLYLRVLAREPRNADALVGRAVLAYWNGKLSAADSGFNRALASRPENAGARAGLAQVYLAEGRLLEALQQAEMAVALAPTDREAMVVRAEIGRVVQPAAVAAVGWDGDSDDNFMWGQVVTATTPLANRVRGFGAIGVYEGTSLPATSAARGAGEIGAAYVQRRWSLTGAFGVQGLWPGTGVSRTALTSRLGGSLRVHQDIRVGLQYAHFPFVESATLIGAGIDVDAIEGTLDANLGPGLTLSSGGGAAWFSDGNIRGSAVLAITNQLPFHLFIGGVFRGGWYESPEPDYFSPDRFSVVSLRGGYARAGSTWVTRLSGGVGVQQIGQSGDWEFEGHVEGRAAWWFGAASRLEAFAGVSNGAYLSATGASRWGTAGLLIRLGL